MSAIVRFWRDVVLPHVPHIIRNDFWRKFFAFAFAALVIWYAHENTKSQMELVSADFKKVPVKFTAVEDGVTLIPREVSVDITVEIPKGMKNLKNTDFYVECQVTKYQVEENQPIELKPEMVKTNVPVEGLKVKTFNPDMLPLDIDIMGTKAVPVLPVCDLGELLEGYQASVVKPEKPVTIRGPEKYLATISSVETEKIPLANVTKSFSRQVDLVPPYEDIVEILSGKVKIEVNVEKNKPRAVENVPVQVLFGRSGANTLSIAKIQPETVTVLVDSVSDIPITQIHPFLDLSDVSKPGVYTVDIKCWADYDSARIIDSVIPAQATVTLEPVAPAASK